MKGEYPHFKTKYSHDELIEHFSFTSVELNFIRQFRGEINQIGVAAFLKGLLYLGYFPDHPSILPKDIRGYLAFEIHSSLYDRTPEYPREGGTRDFHLAAIRECTGFRFMSE